MVWTGALVAACLLAEACANCGSRCTDTTFRAYASCLQNCGANVAVTTCDCSAMACARCPGDNSCCQTCCNLKQRVCSNVNCQQPCNNACCAKCCQPPVEQPQCGNCGPGCQQTGGNCAQGCQQTGGNCPTGCQQTGGNCPTGCQQTGPGCQQPQQQQPPPQSQTTTTTTARPSNPSQSQNPPNQNPPPPAVPDTIHVNVSWPSQPPSVVNVSLGNITVLPANINVLPPNISFTPNITVVVNTSPISQVFPYQYGGNVSLNIEQQVQQLPPLNCTGGRRRCCRVVMAPSYPCPPGMYCPPVVRVACGDQCSTIIQQPVYIQPRPVYYPVPYYRPVYVYVPVQQQPQVFCSSGCVPTASWPFARCYDTPGFMPYSAAGAPWTMPSYSASGAPWTMPSYSASGAPWTMPYSASAVPSMQQYGNLEMAPEAAAAAAATATTTNAQG